MYNNFFLNIDKETFYKCYKTFSNKNLCNILNNSKNVNDYLDMDVLIIIRIIDKLNNNVKENLIKNINIDNLIKLYKNDKISKYDIWKNKNVYMDINFTIKTLNKINLLFLINYMDDYNFKINISKIHFYNLKFIYPIVKNNNIKFKFFINGIDELFLENLIDYFDMDSIKFLNLNYSNILRSNLICEFSNNSFDEINIYVSKLKIILLLRTHDEYKIKKYILEKDINFIKNIINLVEMSTFLFIMKNIKISSFYDLFDKVELSKIKILLPHLNINIIGKIFIKLDFLKLNSIIESLSLNQFLESLYFITDDKLNCLKNMNTEQKFYIENLFNNINDNLYELYFPFFSKQIIFCLLNTSKRNLILENINIINFEIIKSIIKFLNVDEIFLILPKFNYVKKIELINCICKDQYCLIKSFIEDELLNNQNISNCNLINYNLINLIIDLDFNEILNKKLKGEFIVSNIFGIMQ